MLFLVVPFLCLTAGAIYCVRRTCGIREGLIISGLIHLLLILVSSELLGTFGLFNAVSIRIVWLSATVLWAIALWQNGFSSSIEILISQTKSTLLQTARMDRLLLVACKVLACITLFVTLKAVPNNWDSMTYHLPRLMMWLQNGSLDFFPCTDYRQLHNPPLAELTQAHLLVISSYHASSMNIAQWSSAILVTVAASLVAKSMGADLRGQILTAFLVITAPFVLLEASTTQNDLMAGALLICALALWLPLRRRFKLAGWFWGLLAAGLAFATKATALMLLPFLTIAPLVWALRSQKRVIAVALLIVLILPSALWIQRNMSFFGHPLGYMNDYFADKRTNYYKNEFFSLRQMTGCTAKELSLLMATPLPPLNRLTENLVKRLHSAIGLDVNEKRLRFYDVYYFIPPATPNEDAPPAAWHALLAIALLATALIRSVRARKVTAESYVAMLTLLGFVAMATYVKWMPWNGRFLYYWILIPLAALGFQLTRMPRWLISALCILFFILAIPMATLARRRSLVTFTIPYAGLQNHFVSVNSSKEAQLCAHTPHLTEQLADLAQTVGDLNVKTVGLAKGGLDSPFYPIMEMLRSQNPKTKFYFVSLNNRSAFLKQTPKCDVIIHIESKSAPKTPGHSLERIHSNDYGSVWVEKK